jgi:hypothetical protein
VEQVYKSKIDTWLTIVMAAVVIVCLTIFLLSFLTGGASAIAATLPALILGVGLPVWLMTSTCYTLSDNTLLVKSGPFKWKIPISQITSATPTSNPLSSPALSLDRIRIDYGRGRSIMISPKDKARFIQDFESRRVGGR